jgi:uncharacterized DUF497 family protein
VVIIRQIRWLPDVVEKLAVKHAVDPEEVDQLFVNNPLFRRGSKGKRKGENIYYAYGQSDSGRYLFIVFIYKLDRSALILSVRDMESDERRLYLRS